MVPIGKLLILLGLLLVAVGIFVTVSSKFQIPLGRLPGDLFIRRENFTLSFPIVTCLILSLLLTLLLNLFFRR